MNYWVIIDNNKIGPLTLEDLKRVGVKPDTPVWRTGLADWCKASDLDELVPILHTSAPPPVIPPYLTYGNRIPGAPVQPGDSRHGKPMPPTYLVWSIIVTILCCVPCGIAAIVFSSQVSSKYESGDLAGAEKSSERAQLWIVLSIVLGLISMPFTLLLSAV